MQPQSPQTPEPAVPPVPPMPQSPGAAPASFSAPIASQAPSTSSNSPQIADDGDVIEKEWILKIKQILSATKQDPYQQSQQFSALKADYMQKRYGRIIKSEE